MFKDFTRTIFIFCLRGLASNVLLSEVCMRFFILELVMYGWLCIFFCMIFSIYLGTRWQQQG